MWWLLLALPALADEQPQLVTVSPGKSAVLQLSRTPTFFSVTDTEVATVVELGEATTLLVQGRAIGTTDLVISYDDPADPVAILDVTVQRDLAPLRRAIEAIVTPDEE
jgi:hypothetical protein